MTHVDEYRAVLDGLDDWIPYLAANSGLPGPRANLSLVAACAEEADLSRALDLVATDDEFIAVCGLVALGRYVHADNGEHLETLHRYAADPRWRSREGVAMALQRAADDDPETAFTVAEAWAGDDDPLVRRAAVAAVCEPRLLKDHAFAGRALQLLDRVTTDFTTMSREKRRTPGMRTLRQALGYGWSVAIAAAPEGGMALFRRWEADDDPDVRWIVKENRKKTRLRPFLDDSR
jgi:hypothetical protein